MSKLILPVLLLLLGVCLIHFSRTTSGHDSGRGWGLSSTVAVSPSLVELPVQAGSVP